MYINVWAQGRSPHDPAVKDNTLTEEVILLLGGGYYLANINQKTPSRSVHHLLSIISVAAVIGHGQGAEPANTFGFLVEAPNIFQSVRSLVACLRQPFIDGIVDVFVVLVYLVSNFDLCQLVYLTFINKAAPMYLKHLMMLLSIFVFTNMVTRVSAIVSGGKMIGGRGRSNERSRSPVRARSRSMGARGRKRRRANDGAAMDTADMCLL